MSYWKKYLIIITLILLYASSHIYWQMSLQLPQALEGKTITIKGIVVDDPTVKNLTTRFI